MVMEQFAHQQDADIHAALASFRPISLYGLNQQAALLQRRDSKYVLDSGQLQGFLAHARQGFDALEINNRRHFAYRTVYFDSSDFVCYQDHNKGRRRRVKIRLRQYVDNNLFFCEVKLKGRRNLTVKLRQPVSAEDFAAGSLPHHLHQFCFNSIAAHYDEQRAHELMNGLGTSLTLDYNRMTLVSRQGSQRVTIDNPLTFIGRQHSRRLRPDRWIVEVKSRTGVSDLDRWLYLNNCRPVSACSKYCMGVSLMEKPRRNDRFRPILRKHFGLGVF